MRERDREALPGTLPGDGYRLIVDVFAEFGQRAARRDLAAGHQADRRCRAPHASGRSSKRKKLSSVEEPAIASASTRRSGSRARNLKISAEDVDLTLPEGSVYIAEIDQGTTALVLIGDGMLNFHPAPDTEKGQVKIFCGAEVLDDEIRGGLHPRQSVATWRR